MKLVFHISLVDTFVITVMVKYDILDEGWIFKLWSWSGRQMFKSLQYVTSIIHPRRFKSRTQYFLPKFLNIQLTHTKLLNNYVTCLFLLRLKQSIAADCRRNADVEDMLNWYFAYYIL